MTWIENASDNYAILCEYALDNQWEVKDISFALHLLKKGQDYSGVLQMIDEEVLMRKSMPYIHGH